VATTDLRLHETVAAAVGVASQPEFAPPRLGDLPHMAVDASAARRVLGWTPRTPLAEGIARTVEAMRSTALAGH
jgi:UDP-glucose 4-epimerase